MNVKRLLLAAMVVFAASASHGVARAQAPGGPGAPVTGTGQVSDEITPTAEPTPWGWIKMPKITMPKMEMPRMPADPLAPIKSSARKVGDGTKKAWEGTKELFAGGSKEPQGQGQPGQTRIATQGKPPSMWQRMFGAKEEPQDEGPRTVAEWMAQPRLDP